MLNLEELEKQIGKTEDYLKTSTQDLSRRSFRKSYDSGNDESLTSNLESKNDMSSKYADPEERELLVQRLLTDYTSRKERKKNYFDIKDADETERSIREEKQHQAEPDFNKTIRFSSKDFPSYTNPLEDVSHESVFSDDSIPSADHENEVHSYHSNNHFDDHGDNLFYASEIKYDEEPESWKSSRDNFSNKGSTILNNNNFIDLEATQRFFKAENPAEKLFIPRTDKSAVPETKTAIIKPGKDQQHNGRNHYYSLANDESDKEREKQPLPTAREQPTQRIGRSTVRNEDFNKARDRQSSRSHSVDRVFQLSKEQLKLNAEKEFKAAHPFRPSLSRTRSASPSPRPTTAVESFPFQNKRQEKSHFFERLHEMENRHQQKEKQKEQLRNELENLELLQCTFQPEITKRSKKILHSKEKNRKTNLSYDDYREEEEFKEQKNLSSLTNRLHEEASHQKKKLHYLSQHMEEIALSDCTFKPQITSKSNTLAIKHQIKKEYRPETSASSTSASVSPSRVLKAREPVVKYKPIHDRLSELQKEKQQRVRKLRNSIEQEQAMMMTFQPQINPASAKMAQKKFVKQGYSYPLHLRSSSASPTSTSQHKNNQKTNKNGSDEEDLILLTKSDVAERLINEGRRLQRKKQELLFDREQEISQTLEKPFISQGSKKLIQKNEVLR
jgi:hypothetical protein